MVWFLRDLVLASIAWLCGVIGILSFPGTPVFRADRPSDWLTLAMFEPFSLAVSGLLLFTATYLLCLLIARNARDVWRKVSRRNREILFHLLALVYAAYVLAIQAWKAPLVSAVFLGGIAWAVANRSIRTRAIQTEIAEWKSRKK